MTELFKGVILIDLEARQGWERLQPPIHIPVIGEFGIDPNDIQPLAKRLQDSLGQMEEFSADIQAPIGDAVYSLRDVTGIGIVALHLAVLKEVLPVSSPRIDISTVGDWYIPTISNGNRDAFSSDKLLIQNVTLGISMTPPGQQSPWKLAHTIELRPKK